MRTSLAQLYDQVERLNKQVARIKFYEATFSSIHTEDQHTATVRSLSMTSSTALLRLQKPITQLANIMECEVPDA